MNPQGETMGILNLDQLRALAELKRCQKALAEARAAYLHAEANAWSMQISSRQIAAVTGTSYSSVQRRQRLLGTQTIDGIKWDHQLTGDNQ